MTYEILPALLLPNAQSFTVIQACNQSITKCHWPTCPLTKDTVYVTFKLDKCVTI